MHSSTCVECKRKKQTKWAWLDEQDNQTKSTAKCKKKRTNLVSFRSTCNRKLNKFPLKLTSHSRCWSKFDAGMRESGWCNTWKCSFWLQLKFTTTTTATTARNTVLCVSSSGRFSVFKLNFSDAQYTKKKKLLCISFSKC